MIKALTWLLAAVICWAPPIVGSTAQAQNSQYCTDFVSTIRDRPGLAIWLREFYASHSQPILGLEQRLKSGVSWRLVIDGSTKLAMPRITWMPDRQAMQRANRLFDALHGCALVSFYEQMVENYNLAKTTIDSSDDRSALLPGVHANAFVWQPEGTMALTYATSTLVSYSETRAYQGEMRRYPFFMGHVLDLRQDKAYALDDCDHSLDTLTLASTFRLGDWLEVCDPAAHDKFIALWKSKVEAVARTAAYKRDAWNRYCKEDDFDLAPPSGRFVDFTLTENGLAVHTGYVDRPARECMMKKSPFNPVIIPYRELEPFMKPGPWRDELLKSGG